MPRIAGKRRKVTDGHERVRKDGGVVQLVRDDIRGAGRDRGASSLLDEQRLVSVLVVVHVLPRAGVAPDEARLAVSAGVRGIVPVVGLRPLPAQPRRFLPVGLADDGVVALADAALLDGYRREDVARRVRRGAGLALHAVAIVGEVVVGRKLCSHAGYVVEARPVAVGIRVGLVRHHVVQAADLLEANLRRAAVDVHDLPRVLQRLGVGFVDGDPHPVRNVLDAQVPPPRIVAHDAPRPGRDVVVGVRVRVLEELERRSGDADRPVRREPHEAGDLPLDRRAERDAELEGAEGRPLQRVAVAVRAVLVAAVALVAEVVVVVSAASAATGVVVCVFRRAGPHLHAVHVHPARAAVGRGRHVSVVSESARHGQLAAVVVPAAAPVVVPFLAQALRVERIVLLFVVGIAVPVVAQPVIAASVSGAVPRD